VAAAATHLSPPPPQSMTTPGEGDMRCRHATTLERQRMCVSPEPSAIWHVVYDEDAFESLEEEDLSKDQVEEAMLHYQDDRWKGLGDAAAVLKRSARRVQSPDEPQPGVGWNRQRRCWRVCVRKRFFGSFKDLHAARKSARQAYALLAATGKEDGKAGSAEYPARKAGRMLTYASSARSASTSRRASGAAEASKPTNTLSSGIRQHTSAYVSIRQHASKPTNTLSSGRFSKGKRERGGAVAGAVAGAQKRAAACREDSLALEPPSRARQEAARVRLCRQNALVYKLDAVLPVEFHTTRVRRYIYDICYNIYINMYYIRLCSSWMRVLPCLQEFRTGAEWGGFTF